MWIVRVQGVWKSSEPAAAAEANEGPEDHEGSSPKL